MALPDVYSKAIGFFSFYFLLFTFYTCSHTVRKYLRHTARRAVEFISLQAFTQVVISFSLAVSMEAGGGICSGGFNGENVQRMSPCIEAFDGLHFGSCA